MEVRLSNMTAAKAISDAVRTSLGPKGMDKMVGHHHLSERRLGREMIPSLTHLLDLHIKRRSHRDE